MSVRVRFWRWYRTLPILAMALVAVMTLVPATMPSSLLRRYVYPVKYQEQIVDSSSRYGVDPRLVCAIIKCESDWNENARSAMGAVGLMQLMPDTSAELAANGVVDRWAYDPSYLTDPATNIEYGCAYLAQLDAQLESTDEVIAAYNAGPGSVQEWLSGGGVITEVIGYPETALYLMRVNEAYTRYQDLYTEVLNER